MLLSNCTQFLVHYVCQVREASSTASWRTSPLSHGDVINRQLARGKTVNPLLEAPYVTTSIFRRDWLHCSDQGVASDFLGNFFKRLHEKYPGANKKERYMALFQDVLAFYKEFDVSDRLDTLLPTSVEKQKSGYKLKASAAQTRALVPFAYRLATEICDLTDPVEEALYWAAYHLNETYKTLSSECPEPLLKKAQHGPQFALQYVALHDLLNPEDDKAFRIKPKMHLFLHVCAEDDLPAKNWCYRDEDFGGSAAKMSRRRGGVRSLHGVSSVTLERFKAHTPRVCIR